MFSWADIRTLLTTYQNTGNFLKNKVTILLVAPNPQDLDTYNLYSLNIDNVTDLITKLNADWNGPKMNGLTDEQKLLRLNKQLGNEYLKNSNNIEKYFLTKFADYGISLYKADPESENFNWDKLKLDNNNVVKEPCNN